MFTIIKTLWVLRNVKNIQIFLFKVVKNKNVSGRACSRIKERSCKEISLFLFLSLSPSLSDCLSCSLIPIHPSHPKSNSSSPPPQYLFFINPLCPPPQSLFFINPLCPLSLIPCPSLSLSSALTYVPPSRPPVVARQQASPPTPFSSSAH